MFFHLSISLFLLFYYYSNKRLELLEDILWKLIILKSFLISLQQPILIYIILNDHGMPSDYDFLAINKSMENIFMLLPDIEQKSA